MSGLLGRAASFLLSTGIVGAASAQELALNDICPIENGVRVFRPNGMMRAAIEVGRVPRSVIDRDHDDTETVRERLLVITDYECSDETSACKAATKAIADAQTSLFSVFDRQDVVITRKAVASSNDMQQAPWLKIKAERGKIGSIGELVDPEQRFLSVRCVPTEVPVDTSALAAAPKKLEPRVTGKLEELTRNGESLRDIDPATVSIEHDGAAKTLSFDVNLYAGVAVPIGGDSTLIPFIQYQRTSLRDRSSSPATTTRSPDKLGVGTLAGLRVGRHDQIDAAPIYLVDYEHRSRIVSLKSNWIPGFLRQIPGLAVQGSYEIAPGVLAFGLTPRVLVHGSHVIDAGDNAELKRTANYLRLGGDVTLDLFGLGPVSGFTASIAYKRLAKVTVGPRDVDFLKANVQYWVDGGENFSVGYTYERGRDEDTADRINRWLVNFGIRF